MVRGFIEYFTYPGDKPGWELTIKSSFKAKGRASRLEYWIFQCAYWGSAFLLSWIADETGLVWVNVAAGVFIWALMPAQISLAIRRAHDSGRPGWWLLIPFGSLFISLVQGDAEENAYGEPHPYVIRHLE
jgi:uncharacterized membrane protein YhaH (DUF805 family)